jgi:hypothetical protein
MNDATKHTFGFTATLVSGAGAITLHDVNEWGSFACWVIGCVAGLCTIHSWWKKQHKHKK